MARRFLRLDRSGHLDRAAEQQQLLGQRRFTGVRVRNDREGAAFFDFGREFSHVGNGGEKRAILAEARYR
jgi:hypothetical protein